MRSKSGKWLLLIVIFNCVALLADDKRDAANAIIQHAMETSAVLHWNELPPSRVSGDFRFLGKDVEGSGSYVRDILSPELWRERAQMDKYLQFRVRKHDKLWLAQSFEFSPMRAYQFTEAFHPRLELLQKADTVTGVASHTVNGEEIQCVTMLAYGDSPDLRQRHYFCVNAATGALVLYQTKDFAVTYSNFQKMAQWLVPTHIQIGGGRHDRCGRHGFLCEDRPHRK